jgi:hypothetical protein
MLVQFKQNLAGLILSAVALGSWIHLSYAGQAGPSAASAPAAGSHRYLEAGPGEASDAEAAQRRAGHLSPAERKLLRQHVEDAARDNYKR